MPCNEAEPARYLCGADAADVTCDNCPDPDSCIDYAHEPPADPLPGTQKPACPNPGCEGPTLTHDGSAIGCGLDRLSEECEA